MPHADALRCALTASLGRRIINLPAFHQGPNISLDSMFGTCCGCFIVAGTAQVEQLVGHEEAACCAVWSPSGRNAVTAAADGTPLTLYPAVVTAYCLHLAMRLPCCLT